jgi:uncharacterized protein with HEPN domain
MRNERERLLDILDAIERIEKETAKGHDAFDKSELVQVWMVHHLMIIGEAVRAIDPAFKQKHPAVPWRQIAGMRNIIVHDYFRVNRDIVWETVTKDIPSLKGQILSTLASPPDDNS